MSFPLNTNPPAFAKFDLNDLRENPLRVSADVNFSSKMFK